jgi:streptomycin 6-kinase
MTGRRLGPVPEGARARLLAHYGDVVRPWLSTVPEALNEVAIRLEILDVNYHDWGHASVVSHGRTTLGRGLVLKAPFDPIRLAREAAALRFWNGHSVPRLVSVEEDLGVLVSELVEPGPGGSRPPEGEVTVVAEALSRLHRVALHDIDDLLPTLADYYARDVVTRMDERDKATGLVVDRALVTAVKCLAGVLPGVGGQQVLHGDLYRENTLFDPEGRVVFIDPLPVIGPPVYDWAFWCVYYDFHQGFDERLAIASSQIGDTTDLMPWCLLLAVDGLLYFLTIRDGRRTRRAQEIIKVLRELPEFRTMTMP